MTRQPPYWWAGFTPNSAVPEHRPPKLCGERKRGCATVTESELRKLRSELCKQPNPVGELAALSPEPPVANPQSRPFADPYYWAAFTVVGH